MAEIAKCHESNLECRVRALEALENLPIKPVCQYAMTFICRKNPTTDFQQVAFVILKKCHHSNFNSTVFQNTCPTPQTFFDSIAALEILIDLTTQTFILSKKANEIAKTIGKISLPEVRFFFN